MNTSLSTALTNALVVEALVAGHGILTNAARHLSERLGQPVPRSTLAQRVQASPILLAAQQAAEERAFARAIEAGREVRRQRRSAAMRERWAKRRQGQAEGADELEQVDALDARNVRAHTRASWAPTPATVQAARDRRLCMARTRKGFPCVRRVAPGRNRCVSHGGASTGPKTAAGKARIAAAQRARWEQFRRECTSSPDADNAG